MATFPRFEPIDLTPLRMLSLYSDIAGVDSQQSRSGPVNQQPSSPYESEFATGPTPYSPIQPPDPNEYQSEFAEGPTDYSNYVNPIQPPRVPTYQGGIDRPDPLKPMTTQELMEIAQKLYTPQTAASTRFNELLGNFPERESPGWLRGIGAIAASAGPGGYETGQKIMDTPYLRDIAAWKEQVGPAYNAVQGENYANAQERQLATGLATNVVNQNRYDQQNRIAEFNAQSKRIRDQAYAFKQSLPDPDNWVQEQGGPTLVWVNRTTQERRDTGIPVRLMNEEDKLMLQYGMDWNLMLGRGADARLTNASPRFDTSQTAPPDAEERASIEYQNLQRALQNNFARYQDLVTRGGDGGYDLKRPYPTGQPSSYWDTPQAAQDRLTRFNELLQVMRIQGPTPQQGQPQLPPGPSATPPPVGNRGFSAAPQPQAGPTPPPEGSANPGNYPSASPFPASREPTLPRGTPVGGPFTASSIPNIPQPAPAGPTPAPGSQGQSGPITKEQQDAGLRDGTYTIAIKGNDIRVILNTPSSISQFEQQGYRVGGQ